MAMMILEDYNRIPEAARGAVLALGNFDGVHRGHQVVLQAAIDTAREKGGEAPAGAMVFEPHPRRFFQPDLPFFDLTPLHVKLKLLEAFGLDLTVALPFNAALAALTAREFVERVLVKGLRVSHVVTGYDFAFGKGRAGNTAFLRECGKKHGFGVTIIEPVSENGSAVISSSGVRGALRVGQPRYAARLLGHWWSVTGTVRHGDGRGKGLGYPTANLRLHKNCDPKMGIYAVRVFIHQEARSAEGATGITEDRLHGVAYFGTRPTFGGIEPVLEPYLFDFDGDLYGQEIEVEFIEYIRGDARFSNPEDLKRQINDDCQRARKVLAAIEANDPMLAYPLGRRRERLVHQY